MISYRIIPASLAAMAAMAALPAHAQELCAAALEIAPSYHCAEAGKGLALSQDAARAELLAQYGLAGEHRFQSHFGREVARYALIDSDGRSDVSPLQRALNEAGFRRTLPWLSREAYATALRTATAQMVDVMAAADGLDEGDKTALLAEEMARAERGLSRYEMDLFEATVVPHEIGHGWYTEAFWPGFVMDREGHYGSPSPDWLDETAAILMESGDSADQRRYHFREAYRGLDDSVGAAELLALGDFLLRDHPLKAENAAAAEQVRSDTGAPSVQVVPSTTAGGPRSGALYYEQGRMFADFLVDRTGDQTVFGSIAEAFGAGRGIEDWLSDKGADHHLPADVAGLERDWIAWLAARFGPPASG